VSRPSSRSEGEGTADPLHRPRLHIDGVHKAFGSNHVLRGIDLTVDDHEVVTLIGPSGCGKSTLLRCIDILDPIDAGAIMLDGVDVSWPGRDANVVRRKVGIVFQSFNLFPHMTVLQNVTLSPRKTLGRGKGQADDDAKTLLSRFGLAEKANDYPDRLSGGQQQRVAIVRALAMDPQIMLFDEITSALDPELVGEVLDVIRELKDAGLTMVMATHEMGFAREIATRVAFLDEGVVAEIAAPDQLFDEPQQARTQQFLRRVTEARRL
jgi:polar amino acid transport system ATP-binding protein